MPKIVGAFLSAEGRDERANSPVKAGDGALSNFAQVGFEFAEGILDGIKVWRILRQIAKRRSCGFDRLSYARHFVSCKVVHHDYIVSLESWDEALFDIGKKHFSVHRAVDHHRRRHTVVTQRGHEGDVFQCPCGTRSTSLTPRGPRPRSRTMFVLTAVSSRNTSRAGSSRPCSRIQRRRARATSARCCSAARRLFFK